MGGGDLQVDILYEASGLVVEESLVERSWTSTGRVETTDVVVGGLDAIRGGIQSSWHGER